jgi:hypothetical protein
MRLSPVAPEDFEIYLPALLAYKSDHEQTEGA